MFCDTHPITPAAPAVPLPPAPPVDPDRTRPLLAGDEVFARAVLAPQGAERRFALHEIVDDRGQAQARDLLFRLDSLHAGSGEGPEPERISGALANALLDGFAAGRLPRGRLFIAMDEACLHSPLAEAVTDRVGVVLLRRDIRISTTVLMRVAQLRAAGVRFGIDSMSSEQDPRWLLAPYADSVRLDLGSVPPDLLAALADRADAEGLEVIGCGVQTMVGYQRLSDLAVTLLQGPFIAMPRELTVPALPGCHEPTLLRTRQLLGNRVSLEAVAVAAAADPALVMRLQLLHRLYGGGHGADPDSLANLLQALPGGVLAAWLEILQRTACHDHQLGWAASVRDQVETYRRALCRRSGGLEQEREAIESAVWQFLKRLSGSAHYFKTLRYPSPPSARSAPFPPKAG